MPANPNLLRDIAANVQTKLLADLARSRPVTHSGTKGDITESAWISLLKEYLPTRFRIAKGIVIDYKGQTSDQIDCVIFDSQFTPQIIPSEPSLYIPAEAIHAVFEVKQSVNKRHLEYAAAKVKSVRDLCRTSMTYIGDGKSRKKKLPFYIIGGLFALEGRLDSSSFLLNLEKIDNIAHLDFVFSAENGYADLVRPKHFMKTKKAKQMRNKEKPFLVEGMVGTSYGLIRLLEELSWQGTVPAVEWSKYLANLAEPKALSSSK